MPIRYPDRGSSRLEVVPERLPDIWRAPAVDLRPLAGSVTEGAAHAYEVAADELEAALRLLSDELLTLTKTADLSGFSPDHLGRLVRTGQLRNYGRRYSPRIRRGDLPAKPGAQTASGTYDPIADAAALREKLAREVVRRDRQPR
jgi:hypothetical protein